MQCCHAFRIKILLILDLLKLLSNLTFFSGDYENYPHDILAVNFQQVLEKLKDFV